MIFAHRKYVARMLSGRDTYGEDGGDRNRTKGNKNTMKQNKKALFPDVKQAISTLADYKRAKREAESILANERGVWKNVYASGESSSWIFNSIVNKHADIIDNIPTAVCLPREKRDEADADMLSRIIPVIMQRCNFEQIYSDNSWEKLKHGTAIYGVFWNGALMGGLGDIDIRGVRIDDIFWESGVDDIQNSKNLFIVATADPNELEASYPHFKYADQRAADTAVSATLGYSAGEGRCTVVDWYYKKYDDAGNAILHYCKFAGECALYSSENDPAYKDSGWYEHGLYPVVFDRMYPRNDGLCGFGMIAIGEGVQRYINKLDDNVMAYSDWASRVRFWAKRSLGVNEKEFLDLDRSIVEVEGDIDEEKLRQIEIARMDGSIIDVKRMKIDELKEITGSRDVSQGGISGGVTAASAISILREAGAKSSRDGIEGSYRAYVRIISMIIELIRQFYDSERTFRIVGESGELSYSGFSGKKLRGDDSHKPFFDIEISAIKKSPTEAAERNEFAKALYDADAFSKEKAAQTLMMLDLMDFEGIGRLKSALRRLLDGTDVDAQSI